MILKRTLTINAHPERVWPLVAHTDKLNREMGLPPVAFTFHPLSSGGSRVSAHAQLGPIHLRYRELPFQWMRGRWFRERRIFESGPIKQVDMEVSITSVGESTRIDAVMEIQPNGALGTVAAKAMGTKFANDFVTTCRKFERNLVGQATTPYPTHSASVPADRDRLTARLQRLLDSGADADLANRLAEWLSTCTPEDAVLIRPFELADRWHMDRHRLLETCLMAAARGVELLELRWRVLCSNCRGNLSPASTLTDLSGSAHCPACNIQYDAQFDRNVEVCFRVAPAVRPVQAVTYCIGGPNLTPHRAAQLVLEPGESRTEIVTAPEGRFRLTSPQLGVITDVLVAADGPLKIEIPTQIDEGTVLRMAPSSEWTIQNPTDQELQLCLDEAEWVRDAATAAMVTSLQTFRDQFSSEVLSPGVEIGVEQVTVLFSDLRGSTAMYRDQGDAAGYAAVRDHFETMRRIIRKHNGAIVKTIGDAVMATFTDPADGLTAALEIQTSAHTGLDELAVKLGLHCGPAIAVTANDLLDYFGQTVNMAARLQGESTGGDVVISEHMATDPRCAKLLETAGWPLERTSTLVRGFLEPVEMVRILAHTVAVNG